MNKIQLYNRGRRAVKKFCEKNNLPVPEMQAIDRKEWWVSPCAYYRKSTIFICLPLCATPATEDQFRNWNWPGSTTDREPYGVLCHELGHHTDVQLSPEGQRGSYHGIFSKKMFEKCNEPPITSYAPNYTEWFAEIFRLFVTNHKLLQAIRPVAHNYLRERLTPISKSCWKKELGEEVPPRIIRALENKIRKRN